MSYNFDNNQNHYYFNNKNSLPIIFIHGVGLNQQMWKPQIEFFKDNSFITYDLLGHGKTPFNSQELTMENFTDQLSNLVNNLNIEKFNLIGFSIGSLIAIEFSSKYQNYLNSLTLISTTYKRTDEERQNVIDRVNLAKKNMPISQMAMKRWFSDKYLEQNPELYDEFMKTLIRVFINSSYNSGFCSRYLSENHLFIAICDIGIFFFAKLTLSITFCLSSSVLLYVVDIRVKEFK